MSWVGLSVNMMCEIDKDCCRVKGKQKDLRQGSTKIWSKVERKVRQPRTARYFVFDKASSEKDYNLCHFLDQQIEKRFDLMFQSS